MTPTTHGQQRPRIARPRVTTRVAEALERGSVLLEAPAGYGKTTVLQEAVARLAMAAAWVRCSAAERHPDQLVASLVAAIEEALPGASQSVVDTIVALPQHVDAVAAASILMADLDRLLVDPLVIVIDDAEHIVDVAGNADILAEMVRAPSRLVRVAVSARRRLGLAVAKASLTGTLETIGAAELAFDVSETAAYLEAVTGALPHDANVEALFLATEGWPVAVETLARASGGIVARSPDELAAFIREEILDPLGATERDAVLSSAVPKVLTPEMRDALGLPVDFVARTIALGLVLRHAEPGTDTYVYHPLVSDVLRVELARGAAPSELARLHVRVGRALAEAGQHGDAIEHWLDAGAWDEAASLLAEAGERAAQGSFGRLRAWIDRLPEDVKASTRLALMDGVLYAGAGDYERAVAVLGAALESPVDAPATHEWRARLALVDSLTMLGRYEDAVDSIRALDLTDAPDGGPYAASAVMYAARCLAALGREEESDTLAELGRSLPGSEVAAPIDLLRQAYLDLPAGRLAETLDRAEAMFAGLDRSETFLLHFGVMTTIGLALTEMGRFDEALAWWSRLGDDAADSLESRVVGIAHGWQALLLSQLGRNAEAEAELARHPTPPTWVGYTQAVAHATLAAARGDHEATSNAARAAVDLVATAAPLNRAWVAGALVPPLVQVGALARAEDLLSDALQLVDRVYEGDQGRFLRARLLALRSWLSSARGDRDASDRDLVRAIHDAGEQRADLFRREWDRLEGLIVSGLERDVLEPNRVIRSISEAFPDGLALVPFTSHPDPAVRRAALGPALASGHPAAGAALVELSDDPDPAVASAARGLLSGISITPPPRVFSVLGGFSVRRGAWTVTDREWGRPAAARLVRFLLVHRDVAVPEDVLFESFWPELAPSGARRSLQVAASRIRAALDHPNTATSVLDVVDGAYRLRLDDTDVIDSAEFEAAAAIALAASVEDRGLLERARSLWGGEPLPEDRYADWAASWRSRLVDRYVEVVLALLRVYQDTGDHSGAIGAAVELVDLDPLDESAHRELMAAYARSGRTGRALRQYLECRRLLVNGLGVEPSETTSRLHRRILVGDPV